MGLSQQCPKSISVGAVTNDNHVLRASVRPGTSTSSTPRLRAHPCPCSAGTDRAAIKAPRGTFKLPCLFSSPPLSIRARMSPEHSTEPPQEPRVLSLPLQPWFLASPPNHKMSLALQPTRCSFFCFFSISLPLSPK